MNSSELFFFSLFLLAIVSILLFDLLIVGRKSHIISFKEASLWSLLWVSLSVGFYFLLRYHGSMIHGIDNFLTLEQIVESYKHPREIIVPGNFDLSIAMYQKNLALEYLVGYIIEYSLSIDNVFVIIMIFYSFNISEKYYKRVLFWGILGAIIMRFVFIFIVAALVYKFHWMLWVFGGLLIYTGINMFIKRNKTEKVDSKHHPVVRFTSKYFRVFPRLVGNHFFVQKNKLIYATPLFLVLLVVEFSDVIFAVDSVPAIFSVTKDPYIVFFSNIFAILGLRSLFFLVIHIIKFFHYLKTGLSVLLVFIGVKMLLHEKLQSIGFTTEHSLYIVSGILLISILLSVIFPKKEALQKINN